MAQLEDHVARNLSQLPNFGVELPTMEFSSVRNFFLFFSPLSLSLSSVVYSKDVERVKKKKRKKKESVLKYFDFLVKQVAGLAGENPGPSRRLEIAAHLSLIRNNLFDHRTPHFHPL